MLHAICLTWFWKCLEFWMYYHCQYAKLLNIPLVLNMPCFWIYQGYKYASFTQDSKYAWVIPECLNVSQACKWGPHACGGRHTGKSICQHNLSCRQHSKFYQKLLWPKFLFFSRLKGDLFLNFCVCPYGLSWVKVFWKYEKKSFLKKRNMCVFIKGIIRKTNCYWYMHFFFDLHVFMS